MSQKYNTTDQWLPCDWNPVEEQDKCQRCGKIPDVIYYRQNTPGSTTGDYWCRECAETTEQEISEQQ